MPNSRIIDICHTIHDGMITYKGLPPPVITDHLSRDDSRRHYDAGTEFYIGKIEMVANTGTYIDSPFHRYREREDVSQLDLNSVANLDGLVVRCLNNTSRGVSPDLLKGLDVNGKAVLFHTGWDQYWRKEKYWNGSHPFLIAETATFLADSGARLVGIDSYNIDDITDGRRPVHSILLDKGIPIVEHLWGLNEIPDSGFRFFAVPVKVRGLGSFPVRAFAILTE
jgi:arylformamidase